MYEQAYIFKDTNDKLINVNFLLLDQLEIVRKFR